MSVQTHSIDPPIYGRYVRIIPRGWKSHISMRLELYGGPWSKSYCSSFVKWKKKYALKVRNDTEMILGERGGGAVHVFTLLSTSLQWPLSSVSKVAFEETYCTD